MQKHEFQNRTVYLGSPQISIVIDFPPPFAVLLSVYNKQELLEIEKIIIALLEAGCIEFCCVGPEAETLHDSIDNLIEDRGSFDVITTFHLDETDACEYFLFATGGEIKSLLALISQHPKLVTILKKEINHDQ